MKSSSYALVASMILFLAIGACLYLLWEKSRISANPTSESVVALQTERDRLQKLLESEPCEIAAALGNLSQEETSGTSSSGLPQSVAPTASPGEKKAEPDAQSGRASRTSKAHQLEAATVLILNLQANGDLGIGTGFFVAPGVVVTNLHVAGGQGATLLVANKTLNRLAPAQVIAQSSAKGKGGRDYAVLRVEMPAGSQTTVLPLRAGAERTEKISAWGYPVAITRNDPAYQALLNGDIKAIPEVVYSEGVISVVLDRKPPLIAHTAALSPGNSGGPLVDENGNCVGVNTMISLDEDSYRQTSLSLAAADLIDFLRSVGVTGFVTDAAPEAKASLPNTPARP